MFSPGTTADRFFGDAMPRSSIPLIRKEETPGRSEMMSSRLAEDVTTEPEIVSLTSVTGVVAIMKDVSKDANISGKFGRKDSPDGAY